MYLYIGMYVYLYIIQADQFCKVGFSKDPKHRLREIATGCPVKPILKFYKRVNNVEIMEKRCHSVLKQYHSHLEWFKIEFDQCFDIVSKVLTEWAYKETERPKSTTIKFNPESLTETEAQLFIDRDEKVFNNTFLESVGIIDTHKGWEYKIDNALRTYYGDIK